MLHNSWLLLGTVFVVLGFIPDTSCIEYKVTGDHKWINTDNSWYTLETSNFTSATAYVNFTIVFNIDKCCPGLTMGTSTVLDAYKEMSCLNYSAYYKEVFPDISTQFVELNPRKPTGMKDAQCREKPPFYYCNGTLKARGAYKDKWEVAAFYLCDQEHNLDLMYNLDMSPDDGSGENSNLPNCEPPDKRSPHCFKYGQNITIPNLFGAETHNDAREMTYIYIGQQILESRCHQHVEEFACRSMYPECDQSDVMYPCRSMCNEVLSACNSFFDNFPALDCRAYPVRGNGTHCFSRPVECPFPEQPVNGRVHYESISLRGKATYTCDRRHTLIGETTRTCMANGTWSGSKPICEPIARVPMPTAYASIACQMSAHASIACQMFILIGLIVVIYRQRLTIFKFSALCNSFPFNITKDSDKEFDVGIFHHELDYSWVQQTLMSSLKRSFKITVQGRDEMPGKSHFAFTEHAINKSNCCIVVISPEYIKCNLEVHKFRLAQLEHLQKDNFKVIAILWQIKPHLIPDNIRPLLKFTEYLQYEDSPCFWEDLDALIPQEAQHSSDNLYSGKNNQTKQPPKCRRLLSINDIVNEQESKETDNEMYVFCMNYAFN